MGTITANGMTSITARSNAFRKLIALLMAVATTACQPTAHASKENTMIQLNLSVWQLIEDIQTTAFTLPNVEKLLGQSLVEQTQQSNVSFQFFAGRQLALAGNVNIVDIDLRLPRKTTGNPANPGMLALHLGGECITLKQVNQQFSDLAITDIPRGESPEEATTFTANTAWGGVSFGFQEKKPDCVGYLVFNPAQ